MLNKAWMLSLLILVSPSVTADASERLIAFSCRNCHSSSTQKIPKLQDLSSAQIQQALLDFKAGRRESTVMGRLAKGFSDQEIQAVAEWIAQQRR